MKRQRKATTLRLEEQDIKALEKLKQYYGIGSDNQAILMAIRLVARQIEEGRASSRQFVARHGLQEQILAAVSTTSPGQPATCQAAAQTIATLFARHPMPDEIAEAIRQTYVRLGGGDLPVAVRSSATAEDLPDL